MVVKTFRGLLADGEQERIRLSTIKGKVGYKIMKFQVIPETPATTINESTVKIFKNEQSSVTATINFSDSDLLAAAFYRGTAVPSQAISPTTIIFDNQTVNQDIYITHEDSESSAISMNYYIEMEVIPLDDAGAEYTTLKDMRQT